MNKLKNLFLTIISTLLIILPGFSQFAPTIAAETAINERSVTEDVYEIYPVPHSIEYGDNQLTLDQEFQVIFDETIDEVTKQKALKIFEENNLPAPEVVEEATAGKATLVVGIAEDAVNDEMDYDQIDAHYLEISADSITVIGKDSDAAFYGLVSLDAILQQNQDHSIRTLTIKDYANTKVRGFIEGFYGIPWSNDDRKSLMEFGGQFKNTVYMFAPKDDPYHRAQWDELYPQEELDEIRDMTEVGHENKVEFVWTISPFVGVAPIAQQQGQAAAMALLEENTEKLLAKFEQLYEAGVRQFGVLGDDVGALPLDYVVAQMDSVSEWAAEKGDVKDTSYTPAAYNSAWAWDGGRELNRLEEHFADNIDILWTGSSTVGRVTQNTINDFKNLDNNGVVRRDPLFWLNWPVNDVDMTRVFLGKGSMLNPGVKNLAGVVTNPMQEAEASKIAIFAIADYAWNTESFDADQSWEDSFKYIEPDAPEALHTLAKHMTHADPSVGMAADESEDIKELLESTLRVLERGEPLGAEAVELMVEFQKIVDAADTFMAESKNENLKQELRPFINALRDMVLADIEFLKAQELIELEDNEAAWNLTKTAATLREQSLNYYRPMREGLNDLKAKPAAKRLQPFSDRLNVQVTKNMEKLVDFNIVESESKVFTNDDNYKDLPLIDEMDLAAFTEPIDLNLGKNKYVGIKLNRIKDLSNIDVTENEKITLESSLNGIEWEIVNNLAEPNNARYVRLINKTNDSIKFSLDTFRIESNEVYPITMLEKNVDLYQSRGTNLVDGDLTSHIWFAEPQQEGQFVSYDLGGKINLEQLKLYVLENEGDYPRHAVIESSINGEDWTPVMTIGNQDGPNKGEKENKDSVEDIFQNVEGNYRTIEATDINQEARYLRFRITRTKEGLGNWLRMQEIEINGNEHYKKINDPSIKTTVNGTMDNVIENTIDGKLSTKFEALQNQAGEIIYHVGEIEKRITGLTILEEPTSPSNSIVSVRTLEGWQKVGVTESGYTFIDLTGIKNVLDVKIEWSDTVNPTFYQIHIDKIDKADDVERATTAVEQAEATKLAEDIAAAQELVTALVDSVEKSALQDRLDAIDVEAPEETEEEAKRAAGLVSRKIYRLPNVRVLTVEDERLVEAARAAYDDLSDQAKGYVTTLGNLELRENRLAALSAENGEVVDQFGVIALQRRIYRLPSARVLTVEDAPQVEGIRADYDALNDVSKATFSPQYLKNLELREAKLEALGKN